MSEADAPLVIRFDIADDWHCVDLVREAVARCISAAYSNEDLRDAIAMVAAELLENAVKYGREGARISFSLEEADGLTVTVTNAVDEATSHVAQLRERIDWLHTFDDPAKAYLATLAEVYRTGNVNQHGSGLGILRIAYEGCCEVDYDFTGPQQVRVRARCTLTRGSGE